MAFGGQTVTLLSYTQSSQDSAFGVGSMTLTRTDIYGCQHQPLLAQAGGSAGPARAEQQPEIGVSVATSWWQSTCPPDPALLAAKPSDAIEVDGEVYQIIGGVQPFVDLSGHIDHVTILSEKQTVG